MIVLDASAVVELLLNAPAAERLHRRVFEEARLRFAPHLIDIEVAHVMRKYAARGEITGPRGEQALELLRQMRLIRYSHEHLLPRIWELRHSLTAYDAAYVALAESLPAPLITLDARLAASSGHEATIEMV